MKKHVISLVSKLTVPNILFIQEMGKMDSYIFIYTKEVKNELDIIIKSLKLPKEKIETIFVGAVSIQSIYLGMQKKTFSPEDKYFINLTCGTKPMVLTVFQYFTQDSFKHVKMAYVQSKKKTFQFIYPDISPPQELSYKLDIQQFLSSYGVQLHSKQNQLTHSETFIKKYMNSFVRHENPKWVISQMNQFKSQYKNVKEDVLLEEINESIIKALNYLNFLKPQQKYLSIREIKFIMGTWLEEYVYTVLLQKSNLSKPFLAHNVTISKDGTPREMDVFFIYKNTPYYIECKTTIKKGEDYAKTLYKLTSLRDILGIDLKIALVLLTDVKKRLGKYINENPFARAEHHQIHLIQRDAFESGALEDYLDGIFGF